MARPNQRTGIETATALAAWALECLTGEQTSLMWWTDLKDVESRTYADEYPQSVATEKWAVADDRLQAVVTEHTEQGRQTVDLVTVVGTCPQNTWLRYKPYVLTYKTPQRIDVAIAANEPPFGRWVLLSQGDVETWKRDTLPRTFFVDGIPF